MDDQSSRLTKPQANGTTSSLPMQRKPELQQNRPPVKSLEQADLADCEDEDEFFERDSPNYHNFSAQKD